MLPRDSDGSSLVSAREAVMDFATGAIAQEVVLGAAAVALTALVARTEGAVIAAPAATAIACIAVLAVRECP